jgi:hypothetical protein
MPPIDMPHPIVGLYQAAAGEEEQEEHEDIVAFAPKAAGEDVLRVMRGAEAIIDVQAYPIQPLHILPDLGVVVHSPAAAAMLVREEWRFLGAADPISVWACGNLVIIAHLPQIWTFEVDARQQGEEEEEEAAETVDAAGDQSAFSPYPMFGVSGGKEVEVRIVMSQTVFVVVVAGNGIVPAVKIEPTPWSRNSSGGGKVIRLGHSHYVEDGGKVHMLDDPSFPSIHLGAKIEWTCPCELLSLEREHHAVVAIIDKSNASIDGNILERDEDSESWVYATEPFSSSPIPHSQHYALGLTFTTTPRPTTAAPTTPPSSYPSLIELFKS